MNDMKLYMVSTYQKGDIIVYAKNKSEVKDFLDDIELTYYNEDGKKIVKNLKNQRKTPKKGVFCYTFLKVIH